MRKFTITQITPIVPDGVPSALTAIPYSGTRNDLSWTIGSTTHTGHVIERTSVAGGLTGFVQIATVLGSIHNYSDTGLTADTQYYYRVRAFLTVFYSAYSNTANATTFNTEMVALFAAMATQPSDAQKANIGTFIRTLKTAGVWASLDFLAVPCFSHNTGGEALLWWNDPSKTMVNHGATFVKYGGLLTDGISQYFATDYNPHSLTKFLANSASMGLFFTRVSTDNTVLMGANEISATNRDEILYAANGQNYNFINNGDAVRTTPSAESEGFLILSRISATQKIVSKNTINETINSNATNVLSLEWYGGCRNYEGTGPNAYLSPLIGLLFGGGGLIQTQIDSLKDAFVTYLSGLSYTRFDNFIAVGDSIVAGDLTSVPTVNRFSAIVAGTNSVRDLNKGVSSESVQVGLYARRTQFKYLDRNSKIFIMEGINDIYLEIHGGGSRAAFQTNYGLIIDDLISYGYPLANIYMGRITYCTGERQAYLNDYNTIIANIAAAKGVTLIDTYTPMVNPAYLNVDGIHPNDAGHAVLAVAIQSVI
jgi:lysophospholipase L1-like esterase